MKTKIVVIRTLVICLLLVSCSLTLSAPFSSKKVYAATGPDSCINPATTTDPTDTLSLYVSTAGTYTVWTRMQAATGATSIQLNINSNTNSDNDCYNVGGDSNIPTNSTWDWVDDYDGSSSTTQSGNTNLINTSLNQGYNTLELVAPNPGIKIDSILAIPESGGSVACTPSTDSNGNTSCGNLPTTSTSSGTSLYDNTNPPTLTIDNPTSGATLSGTETLSATATSNSELLNTPGSINNVQFKDNGTNIASCDPTSPSSGSIYDCSWNTKNVANGSQTITVVATDGNGFVTTTAVSANVSNSSGSSPATTLDAGQTLTQDDLLKSSNGDYTAVMQADGNFVVYKSNGVAEWDTGTSGNAGSKAVMQSDGNFVVYNANRVPLWNTVTNGYPGSTLVMQNDGNLVLYNSFQRAIWSIFTGPLFATLSPGQTLPSGDSMKATNGEYKAVMQTDGNFVIYNANGVAQWDTGTNGNAGARAVMQQTDGNFVIYNTGNVPLWQAGTSGNAGAWAIMQGDGNFVIYGANNAPLWSRYTGRL